MKTLQAYLVREICATLLMTVAVFTFVLLLANVLKEVVTMLVSAQVPFVTVIFAIVLLIPFVLVYALPMGLLTGTLLVFGRFSADNELTAVRASGVSLLSVISPVLLLGVLLSGVAALINMEIAPRCRVAYKELLWKTGVSRVGAFLPEKTYIKDFPGAIVYIGSAKGTNLTDVLIYKLDETNNRVQLFVRAAEGKLKTEKNVFHLELHNVWGVDLQPGTEVRLPMHSDVATYSYTNNAARDPDRNRVSLSDMTFSQLRAELRNVEANLAHPPAIGKASTEELRKRLREYQEQTLDLASPIKVQIHREAAFSFACIGFTLVGIPLGIRAHGGPDAGHPLLQLLHSRPVARDSGAVFSAPDSLAAELHLPGDWRRSALARQSRNLTLSRLTDSFLQV